MLGGAIGGEEYLEVQKKGVRRYNRRRRMFGYTKVKLEADLVAKIKTMN